MSFTNERNKRAQPYRRVSEYFFRCVYCWYYYYHFLRKIPLFIYMYYNGDKNRIRSFFQECLIEIFQQNFENICAICVYFFFWKKSVLSFSYSKILSHQFFFVIWRRHFLEKNNFASGDLKYRLKNLENLKLSETIRHYAILCQSQNVPFPQPLPPQKNHLDSRWSSSKMIIQRPNKPTTPSDFEHSARWNCQNNNAFYSHFFKSYICHIFENYKYLFSMIFVDDITWRSWEFAFSYTG